MSRTGCRSGGPTRSHCPTRLRCPTPWRVPWAPEPAVPERVPVPAWLREFVPVPLPDPWPLGFAPVVLLPDPVECPAPVLVGPELPVDVHGRLLAPAVSETKLAELEGRPRVAVLLAERERVVVGAVAVPVDRQLVDPLVGRSLASALMAWVRVFWFWPRSD